MSNKPEKKEMPEPQHFYQGVDNPRYTQAIHRYKGYNQACADWEKWLPSEEEIEEIIQLRYFKLMFPDITGSDAEIVASTLATAIAKRLGSEK